MQLRMLRKVGSGLYLALTSFVPWWGISLVLAAIASIASRHEMNPDGISYLDLATEATRSGPGGILNAYWSPGYPALLACAMMLFRPQPEYEFPLVHLVNFGMFALALWAFDYFLRSWTANCHNAAEPGGQRDHRLLIPLAFCLFLWHTLHLTPLRLATPDIGVSAFTFLIAGLACRLRRPQGNLMRYIALGAALGAAYYMKAAMFPSAVAFLASIAFFPPSKEQRRKEVFLCATVFIIIAVPLVASLSRRAGHLSIGESGALNYAWSVNLVPLVWGDGEIREVYGRPIHPPRTLFQRPLVLEFESPIRGSYPLHFEPAYWFAGVRPKIESAQLLRSLKTSLIAYKDIVCLFPIIGIGACVLLLSHARGERRSRVSPPMTWLIVWLVAVLSIYAVVLVESRYVAAAFIILWLQLYVWLESRSRRRVARTVYCIVVAATMFVLVSEASESLSQAIADRNANRRPDYQMVTSALRDLGVVTGDRLAFVGFWAFDAYFVRYARMRVIAQITDEDQFWNLNDDNFEQIAARLEGLGVRAIITRDRATLKPGWRQLTDGYSVFPLGQNRLIRKPQATRETMNTPMSALATAFDSR